MNLSRKKITFVTIILFIILCAVQITNLSLAATRSEEGKIGFETESSPANAKTTTIAVTDETEAKVIIQKETSVKDEIVTSKPAHNKPKKSSKNKKTDSATTKVITTETTRHLKPSYTKNDLFCLAAAVCREAGGSSEEIQLLVANVIVNRVNSTRFPNTIYGVLTQYKQYGSMWKYGVSFPEWADEKVKNQCYSVARRILEGERVCPANVVFQAEFKQGSGVYKQFDGFYFCYL